jgi:hypothetical protein
MPGDKLPYGATGPARPTCNSLRPRRAREHAVHIERGHDLWSEFHQQTGERQDYANGFKPKTLKTHVGQVDLRIR